MKIKIDNQWKSLTWTIGKEDVTDKLRTVALEFPDKSVHDFHVKWEWSKKRYYDMGKPLYAEQYNAFITLKIHGMNIKTNLQDIAKRVKVIDFTTWSKK